MRPDSLNPLLIVYVSSVWSSEQFSINARLHDSRSSPSVFGPVQTESTPRITMSSHTRKCIVHAGEPRTFTPSTRTFLHRSKCITCGRGKPFCGLIMKLSCQYATSLRIVPSPITATFVQEFAPMRAWCVIVGLPLGWSGARITITGSSGKWSVAPFSTTSATLPLSRNAPESHSPGGRTTRPPPDFAAASMAASIASVTGFPSSFAPYAVMGKSRAGGVHSDTVSGKGAPSTTRGITSARTPEAAMHRQTDRNRKPKYISESLRSITLLIDIYDFSIYDLRFTIAFSHL